MPQPQVVIGNFDFIITSEGKIKLFECGPGICGVGYEGYHAENKATMHDQIFAHLLAKFDAIYIVNYSPGLLLKHYCTDNTREKYKDKIKSFSSLEALKRYEDSHSSERAVIIVDRVNNPRMTEPRIVQECEAMGIRSPVVSGSDMYRTLDDKAFFADVFTHYFPEAIPKTWVINRASIESHLKELLSSSIEWFIIKIPQGNRAQGSTIFHRTDIPLFLTAIHNRSVDKLTAFGATAHQVGAISELIQLLDSELPSDMILLQEMMIPTLREKKQSEEFFACTGRFVFCCIQDEVGNISVQLIDGMWKYANQSFSGREPPIPEEIISCVIQTKFKAAPGQSLVCIPDIKINFTDLFDARERTIVTEFVEQGLARFFQQTGLSLLYIFQSPSPILNPETHQYLAQNIDYIHFSKRLAPATRSRFVSAAPTLPTYTPTLFECASLLIATGIDHLKENRNGIAKDNLAAAHKLLTYLLTLPHTDEKKQKMIERLAQVNYNLASAYDRLDNHEKAYHFCCECLAQRMSLKMDEAILSRTRAKLVTLKEKLSEAPSAAENPPQIKKMYEAATADFKNQQFKLAIEKLLLAQQFYEAAGQDLSLSYVLATLASCYRDTHQYSQAIQACEAALCIRTTLFAPSSGEVTKLQTKLAEIQEAQAHFGR